MVKLKKVISWFQSNQIQQRIQKSCCSHTAIFREEEKNEATTENEFQLLQMQWNAPAQL
jgi:hypothetical protein